MLEKLKGTTVFVWLIPINLLFFSYNEMVYAESIKHWMIPLLVIYLFVGMIYYVSFLVFKDKFKSAVGTSLIAFFSSYYAYIFHMFGELRLYKIISLNQYNLLWGAAILGVLFYLYKYQKPMGSLIQYFNLLMILNLSYEIGRCILWEKRAYPKVKDEVSVKLNTKYPDIYFILSDAYTSVEMLKKYHDFDNSDFVHFLDSTGFVVVPNARSSYRYTQRTLASIWNMDYLNDSLSDFPDTPLRYAQLEEILFENESSKWLMQHGYVSENVTSYPFFGKPASEVFKNPSNISHEIYIRSIFYYTISPLIKSFVLITQEKFDHQEIIRSFLSKAAKKTDHPKLVFCHIYMPHEPYVFDRNGNSKLFSNHYYMGPSKYAEQVLYTNSLLKKMIRGVLNLPNHPIVVLTGDHGYRQFYVEPARSEGSYGALTAFHFPSGNYAELRPRLTSPNIMRVVINQLVPGSFPLLKDTSNFYYGVDRKL